LQRLQQLLFSKLAKASGWLFAGGIAGGVLGYLFQILMGRVLTVEEYGLFTALMALTTVMGSPLGTLTMVVSRKVSAYRASQKISDLTHLFYTINFKVLLVAFTLLLLSLFFIEPIQAFLKIENREHLYLLVSLIVISFPQAINNAYLQGMQYFKWLSVSGILGIVLKIISAVLLIWFGFGVSGALGGVVIASILLFIMTYTILLPQLQSEKKLSYDKGHLSFMSALPVLLANTAFIVMTQVDMVLVKHFFTEEQAGLYAAASILGKAVMYLPGGIAIALFPMVAENHADGKSSAHLLIQAVSITSLLCGAGALFYYLFGEWIITLFYGQEYQQAGIILKYYGFAIFPMALVMVAEHFLIAMGQVLFAYLFAVVAPLQLLAIYFYHETLLNVIIILGVSGALLVIIGYSLLWRNYKNGKQTTQLQSK